MYISFVIPSLWLGWKNIPVKYSIISIHCLYLPLTSSHVCVCTQAEAKIIQLTQAYQQVVSEDVFILFKKYGPGKILEPFMADIKELEKVYI